MSITNQKDIDALERGMKGIEPSPNDPKVVAAREAQALAEVLAIRHGQEAQRDAVAQGKKD